MNLSLLAATVMLITWIVLVFFLHIASGAVHLLYAGSVVLFARRVLAGAPAFRT